MSETRATTPAFPPGRYGRRRSAKGRSPLPIVLAVLVLAGALLLTVRLYQQYGQTDYQAQIVGWDDPSDTQMTIHFTVGVPAGQAAECTLRARDYGGNELGRSDVVVRPAGDGTSIDARVPVTTTSKAAVGEVLGCKQAH